MFRSVAVSIATNLAAKSYSTDRQLFKFELLDLGDRPTGATTLNVDNSAIDLLTLAIFEHLRLNDEISLTHVVCQHIDRFTLE